MNRDISSVAQKKLTVVVEVIKPFSQQNEFPIFAPKKSDFDGNQLILLTGQPQARCDYEAKW